MDRAHRIGQKRVVNVYRLITKGTLEEKIMRCVCVRVCVWYVCLWRRKRLHLAGDWLLYTSLQWLHDTTGLLVVGCKVWPFMWCWLNEIVSGIGLDVLLMHLYHNVLWVWIAKQLFAGEDTVISVLNYMCNAILLGKLSCLCEWKQRLSSSSL